MWVCPSLPGNNTACELIRVLIATAEGPKKKRGLFKRKTKQVQSVDDSSMDTLDRVGQDTLRRQVSDTNLASDFLTIPENEKSKSRTSIRDKFTDMSKSISDKHRTKKEKQGKSFSLFKKSKSREPSPVTIADMKSRTLPAEARPSPSEYSEESETESVGLTPDINITRASSNRHILKKTGSDSSFVSTQESEADYQMLEANLDVIDEYYYGVRIFPGQDPSHVYVGWVSPQFHEHSTEFDMKNVRNVVVCSLDVDYEMKSR